MYVYIYIYICLYFNKIYIYRYIKIANLETQIRRNWNILKVLHFRAILYYCVSVVTGTEHPCYCSGKHACCL